MTMAVNPPRQRYRQSGRVRLKQFIPLALLALAIALGGGWVMQQLYALGWYIRILVPIVLMLPVLVAVVAAVGAGRCRSRALAAALGATSAVVLYGGFYYFGMNALMGPRQATRIDLLPSYILFRMRTDVSKDVGHSEPTPGRHANPAVGNWVDFAIEFGILLTTLTTAGYRRADRAYCETCAQWTTQRSLRFAPGYGKTIAGWLASGQFDQLEMLPPGPTTARSAATKLTLEYCLDEKPPRSCGNYLSVREVKPARGESRAQKGKLLLSRTRLSGSEIQTVQRVFNIQTARSADAASLPPATAGTAGLVQVQPVPASEAHQVLNKWSNVIGTALSMSVLLFFYGGIAGAIAAMAWSREPGRHVVGLALAGVCAVVCIVSGYLGLKNPGVMGNRYLYRRARRAFASRRAKLVDIDKPTDLPTFFVQRIPRAHWGRHMLENATDTGFMQIDPRKKEVRFEGDVDRIRFDGSAIQSVVVEQYASEMARTSIQYAVAVVRGRTATGDFEAPFSLRNTNWRVPQDYRQTDAELLRDWINSIRPDSEPELEAELEPAFDTAESPLESSQRPQTPPPLPIAKPASARRGFVRRYGFRFAIIAIAVWFGIFHKHTLAHKRPPTPFNQTTLTDSLLSGARTAPGLALKITHVHTTRTLPGVAELPRTPDSWTVFDCAPVNDSAARFSIAVGDIKSTASPVGFHYTSDFILPRSSDAGKRFVADFATAVGQSAPPLQPAQPLKPTRFFAVRLGQHLGAPATRFARNRGNWVIDQWTIANDGLRGELYFSYDLADGNAQLSRGSQASSADELTALADALRDGPRPARSPANDPTFTNSSPQLVDAKLVSNSAKHRPVFARGGRLMLLIPNTTNQPLLGVPLPARDRTLDLTGDMPGSITRAVALDPDGNRLLIATADIAGYKRTSHRIASQLWLIDRSTHQRHEVTGPWGTNGGLAGDDNAVSPDGRYAIVYGWSQQLLDPNAHAELYVCDLKTGSARRVQTTLSRPNVWKWVSPSQAVVGDADDEDALPMNPTTVDCATATASPGPSGATDSGADELSPSGRLKFQLSPHHSLTVINQTTGKRRTLVFQPIDSRYANAGSMHWLNDRYLRFYAEQPEFIDTSSMKVGLLPRWPKGAKRFVQFSPDFKWGYVNDATGIGLARVKSPPTMSN